MSALLFLIACPGKLSKPDPHQQFRNDIRLLFEKHPSLRTNSYPATIQTVGREVLGTERADRLSRFMMEEPKAFQGLRASVADELVAHETPTHRAVVSGQSVSGMVAAAILARSGYHVETYEQREDYVRNIQWAGRQALVDQLAAVDVKLSELFLKQVARHLDKGSVAVDVDSNRRTSARVAIEAGDPARVPRSGAELMRAESIMNMETKVFETVLSDYLDHHPNVTRYRRTVQLVDPNHDGTYRPEGSKPPDLVVVAEGSNSATRAKLGVKSVPTSPKRVQVAGRIAIDSGGEMVKQWRREGGHLLLTGTMGRAGSGMTWIVADLNPDVQALSPQKLETEFRRLAGSALATKEANKAAVEGFAEGRPLTTFQLQQWISSTAAVGNVIGFGDFVGANHWSVGGGMQIAVVSHGERLKTLLLRLEQGVTRDKAAEEYSAGVLEDTMAWGEIGIRDFYPGVDGTQVSSGFRRAIEAWRNGTAQTPLEELERQLRSPRGPVAAARRDALAQVVMRERGRLADRLDFLHAR